MSPFLAPRLSSLVPRLCRTFMSRAALQPVPPIRGTISSPEAFLKAIGRSAETKVTAEKWEDLWKVDGHQMKKAGIAVRDRRYILWCMEKFRQGQEPGEFAHPPKPKKKIRGHGPAVQNGKRIRSRRHK